MRKLSRNPFHLALMIFSEWRQEIWMKIGLRKRENHRREESQIVIVDDGSNDDDAHNEAFTNKNKRFCTHLERYGLPPIREQRRRINGKLSRLSKNLNSPARPKYPREILCSVFHWSSCPKWLDGRWCLWLVYPHPNSRMQRVSSYCSPGFISSCSSDDSLIWFRLHARFFLFLAQK